MENCESSELLGGTMKKSLRNIMRVSNAQRMIYESSPAKIVQIPNTIQEQKPVPAKDRKRFPYEIFAVRQRPGMLSLKGSPTTNGVKKIRSAPYLKKPLISPIALPENMEDPFHVARQEKTQSAKHKEKSSKENVPGFLPEIKVTEHIEPAKAGKKFNESLLRNDTTNSIREIIKGVNTSQIANLELLLSSKVGSCKKDVYNERTVKLLTSNKRPVVKLAPISNCLKPEGSMTATIIRLGDTQNRPLSYRNETTESPPKLERVHVGSAPPKKTEVVRYKTNKGEPSRFIERLEKSIYHLKPSTFKLEMPPEPATAANEAKDLDATPSFTFGKTQFPKYDH